MKKGNTFDYKKTVSRKPKNNGINFLKKLQLFKQKPKKNYRANTSNTKGRFRSKMGGDQGVSQSNFIQKSFYFLFQVLRLIFLPIFVVGSFITNFLGRFTTKYTPIQIVFVLIFSFIVGNFAILQADSLDFIPSDQGEVLGVYFSRQLITPNRGQIFVQDLTKNGVSNNKYIPITQTENVADIYFNPKQLKGLLDQGVDVEDVAEWIASYLNFSYSEVLEILERETSRDEPRQYVLIQRFINQDQKNIVENLKTNPETRKMAWEIGLDIQEKQVRSYPMDELLAQVVGYVPVFQVSKEEAERIPGCRDLVEKNTERGTQSLAYTVGYYGLEQKFCTEITGLNGKRIISNQESEVRNAAVVDGADIYTTIDKNVQEFTEEILELALEDNTNTEGAPLSGTAVVMDAKTGEILSMASAPTFDPGNYSDYSSNPEVYRNQAGVEYEIGSVMKPLTVAAALNDYQIAKVNPITGNRLGIPPDFKSNAYDQRGKLYEALNGDSVFIQNSEGAVFGPESLDVCILKSINTCIADVVDSLGNVRMRYYLEEVYGFSRATSANLPGDSIGFRNPDIFSKNINCPSCNARYGFGQEFFASPIQLLRAYTPIVNRGTLVEPYLIDRIEYADGTIDRGNTPESPISRQLPRTVMKELVSRQVTQHMVGLLENTQPGIGASKANVPGYEIACKTGTAEKITSETLPNGQVKVYTHAENRNRGLYIHTMVCFNNDTERPLLFLVKIDEPRPGQVSNFSGDTIGPYISLLMKSTFEYLGIRPE